MGHAAFLLPITIAIHGASGMTPIPQYLNPKQAAAYLNISRRTLESWRLKGGGPVYHRLTARAVRYHRDELDGWLAGRTFSSTSDEAARNAA